MKHLALLALLFAALPSASIANAGAVEQQIRANERAMNDAYAANDLDKYFGFYADGMSAIFFNERTTLPAYRKSWTDSVHAGNIVKAVKLDDMQVHVLPAGDVAIASYRIDVTNQRANGAVATEKAFETDVWARHKGAWKVVHVHYALAATPSN